MPGEATETVPVTEQEMQQPQVETGSYIFGILKTCMPCYILKSGVLDVKSLWGWAFRGLSQLAGP